LNEVLLDFVLRFLSHCSFILGFYWFYLRFYTINAQGTVLRRLKWELITFWIKKCLFLRHYILIARKLSTCCTVLPQRFVPEKVNTGKSELQTNGWWTHVQRDITILTSLYRYVIPASLNNWINVLQMNAEIFLLLCAWFLFVLQAPVKCFRLSRAKTVLCNLFLVVCFQNYFVEREMVWVSRNTNRDANGTSVG
jgi:hypothetical protein